MEWAVKHWQFISGIEADKWRIYISRGNGVEGRLEALFRSGGSKRVINAETRCWDYHEVAHNEVVGTRVGQRKTKEATIRVKSAFAESTLAKGLPATPKA